MRAGLAILRDVRVAIKSLRRSPGFTLIAIVTLGLGIGANTSMFSILDGYLLRPAPYPGSDHLDRLYRSTARNPRQGFSPADYLDLRSEMRGYGDIAAYASSDMSLSEPGKLPEVAVGLRVSANLFSVLGATPQLGRGFRDEEEIPGNHRVLVISHRYWQNRLGGDGHIIGRTVRVDGDPYEIVGVLPATFSDWRHLDWVDAYRPLGLDEQEIHDRTSSWLRLVGRRSGTLTRAQADAFIAHVGRRFAADFPAANAGSTWVTVPLDETVIGKDGQRILEMLVGLSGFVLLIACSNLANLLLARTMARAREFAVRAALGASRAQTLRPLFIESLLLALAGGLCAILVALWILDWMQVHSAGDNGVGVTLPLNWLVLSWAFGASLLTALAFGVVPTLFAARLDLNSTLKSGSRGTTGTRGHQRFRHVLIVAQFALAMVLLAGAGLFVRGLHELNNRRYGWESDHLVTGTVVLPTATYADDQTITDFQRLALERLEAIPGVVSASVSYSMPFFGLAEPRKYLIAGRETPKPGQEPAAVINGISPHYFETVGTPLLSGRAFNANDTGTSPPVFIINQAMARGLFGVESPIGRRIARAGAAGAGARAGEAIVWGEIVGVVSDVQSVYPDPAPVSYQVYQPMAQEVRRASEIAVRSAAGVTPSTLVAGIRSAMMAIDEDLPVRKLQPAAATIARANYQLGVLASILSALAMLGLGLASLGTYGVIARSAAQRTGEFGIRLALGAQAGDITRLVLTSGAKLALMGSALGLLGAFGVSRLIAAGFPSMRVDSVPVSICALLLLLAIAQVACYLPARYASRTSPAETLRAE